MVMACIGFWSSLVFYNSYLPEIAAPEDRDRISAKGFVMGYIGSVLLQIICFVLVLKPELLHITKGRASQLSFLMVGIWWWVFGQIALSRLPKGTPSNKERKESFITGGYTELLKVWQQIRKMSLLKRFLFSFFFYNMGVQTVMLAATLYGKSEFNIPVESLIIAILIIQIIAIPGAIFISKMSQKIGNIKTLMVCVMVWILLCIGGYLLPKGNVATFYLLAISVGFVMGGIQSLSRSTYSKFIPVTKDNTSFFSFFDVTEKIAIVIGMFSFGYITEISGSQRNAVLALILFFVIGLIGLYFSLKKQKHQI
jgi:UMF1 family MFS transporter